MRCVACVACVACAAMLCHVRSLAFRQRRDTVATSVCISSCGAFALVGTVGGCIYKYAMQVGRYPTHNTAAHTAVCCFVCAQCVLRDQRAYSTCIRVVNANAHAHGTSLVCILLSARTNMCGFACLHGYACMYGCMCAYAQSGRSVGAYPTAAVGRRKIRKSLVLENINNPAHVDGSAGDRHMGPVTGVWLCVYEREKERREREREGEIKWGGVAVSACVCVCVGRGFCEVILS